MAYVAPVFHTVITLREQELNERALATYNNPKNMAERAAVQAARDNLMNAPKLFGALPVRPTVSNLTVRPTKRIIKQIPAKQARNADTWAKNGGTMHGTTQVVTSGNGIGMVPAAYYGNTNTGNAEWLAWNNRKYR